MLYQLSYEATQSELGQFIELIPLVRRAILVNLQKISHRNLAGYLLVLHATQVYNYKNFSSHGNPLFSSPLHPDFHIVVIFSSENI